MKNQKGLTVVIKLGTSSIVDEKTHEPILSILALIVETAIKLRKHGHRVIIVSSGAVGVGLQRMDMDKRPKHLPKIQALAAIGQCRLMSLWDSLFHYHRQPVAQVLLTRNDIADRTQYRNAQNTFIELLDMGVIPIVNENDTIAVAEIKFGDNDTLSAITAAMVQADYLFLMTDVDCLYTANPRLDPSATAIEVVSDISALTADVSSAGSSLGTGGMSTKIIAARLATSAGVTVVITRSSKPGNVFEIVKYAQYLRQISPAQSSTPGSSMHPTPSSSPPPSPPPPPPLHTRFTASSSPIRDRSFWLLYGLAPHGTIFIDHGAYKALRNKAGLLPVGVVDVEGPFAQQEAVKLVVVTRLQRPSAPTTPGISERPGTPKSPGLAGYEVGGFTSPTSAALYDVTQAPLEVGRALINYSSAEISRIKGQQSTEIRGLLGYADSEYVAYRENISLNERSAEAMSLGGPLGRRSRSGTGTPTRLSMLSMGDLASFA